VVWGTQPRVNARACRFSYGVRIADPYDPDDEEHKGRSIHRWADGTNRVYDVWSAIVARGQVIKAKETASRGYENVYSSKNPELKDFWIKLYAFTIPDRRTPQFTHDPEASELRRGFVEVCKLSANLSSMSGALEQKRGPRGVFWVLNFSVGIEFGGVELQAHVEWVEKGVTKRGKVSIIPPED